uniref:Ribosomal protein L19 n=1 Tax=Chlorodesmis fastigiata TaxID=189431 RepID=A0A2P0QHH1_CHLFS|nr:ribosomal protein L19 [Chlorodesmis fastigiata]ARO74214.1 ribosomal protein L19 [Chlorodesmis fastigiata]
MEYFEKNKQKFGFSVGDFIQVGFCFQEGDKKRIQFFEGIVIAIRGSFSNKKIVLRKPGIYSVERFFAWNSPQIQSWKILKANRAQNSRSKLFYLRKFISW